jgi:predicted nucleic acid-binding protein
MKSRVYLETSVVSYLTALPSRDIVRAAHQQLTRDWWDVREQFELFTSQLVVEEALRGNQDAAARRLSALQGVALLDITDQAHEIAARLLAGGVMPAKAASDALHVGIAVVHGMGYLLTWNCSHIANASIRGKIETMCRAAGLQPPLICTPEELLEE